MTTKTPDKLKRFDIVRVDGRVIYLHERPLMLIQNKMRLFGEDIATGEKVTIEMTRQALEVGTFTDWASTKNDETISGMSDATLLRALDGRI